MRKVEALKALSIAIGVEAASLADASTVVDVLNVIAAHFEGDDDAEFIGDAIANIAAIAGSIVPEPTLIEKTITANDTYNASDDNADGYSKVTVNVQSENNALLDVEPANNFGITRNLGVVDIPNGVTAIGSGAFTYCSNIRTVNIPSTVTTIHSSVFSPCERLTTVTINKAEGSISGAPWGAPETTQVIWTG